MMMSFLALSFISSFSSIMCAMDYMYNTTGGKYHCTCLLYVAVVFNNDVHFAYSFIPSH